jgi:hypothetical protein
LSGLFRKEKPLCKVHDKARLLENRSNPGPGFAAG